MFENVPTDRLTVVLRYLEWQVREVQAELERRVQWVYDNTSGPAPAELHRADCTTAIPSKTAHPIPSDRAAKLMTSPEVQRCTCWSIDPRA